MPAGSLYEPIGDPLRLAPIISSIYIGTVTPEDLYPYDILYEKVFRGAFCGRHVLTWEARKISTNGIVVYPWVSLFADKIEAAYMLGRVVLENLLQVQADGNSVRIAGMAAFADGRRVSYTQMGKVETLLRQMPKRFSYLDLVRAQKTNPETKKMNVNTIVGVLYGHLLAGSLEYVPDTMRKPTAPHNPSFVKLNEVYLSVPRL